MIASLLLLLAWLAFGAILVDEDRGSQLSTAALARRSLAAWIPRPPSRLAGAPSLPTSGATLGRRRACAPAPRAARTRPARESALAGAPWALPHRPAHAPPTPRALARTSDRQRGIVEGDAAKRLSQQAID